MAKAETSSKVLVATREICDGCLMCQLHCSLNKTGTINPYRARIKITFSEKSPYPLPVICRHCNNPPCQTACPVDGVMTADERTGAVVINTVNCIGCLACVEACPFGAIQVGPDREVLKCDLCGGDPACVKYCPPRPAESLPHLPFSRQSSLQYIEPHLMTVNKRLVQASKE